MIPCPALVIERHNLDTFRHVHPLSDTSVKYERNPLEASRYYLLMVLLGPTQFIVLKSYFGSRDTGNFKY